MCQWPKSNRVASQPKTPTPIFGDMPDTGIRGLPQVPKPPGRPKWAQVGLQIRPETVATVGNELGNRVQSKSLG
jgi:hypothetical protein